jgi:hypothetical protein
MVLYYLLLRARWMLTVRAPVDRTTLQPGRRASKAGLESLRTGVDGDVSLRVETGPEGLKPDDDDKRKGKGAVTPGGEGPLKWV